MTKCARPISNEEFMTRKEEIVTQCHNLEKKFRDLTDEEKREDVHRRVAEMRSLYKDFIGADGARMEWLLNQLESLRLRIGDTDC